MIIPNKVLDDFFFFDFDDLLFFAPLIIRLIFPFFLEKHLAIKEDSPYEKDFNTIAEVLTIKLL